MSKKIYVEVNAQFEGFHKFPKASEVFNDSIKFLEDVHRHIFHVSLTVEVFHNDRDIEFILLKRDLQSVLSEIASSMTYAKGVSKSCEMMCEEIYSKMGRYYPKVFTFKESRDIRIKVSEDGENAGIIIWTAE